MSGKWKVESGRPGTPGCTPGHASGPLLAPKHGRALVALVLCVAFVLSVPSASWASFKVTEEKDFITILDGDTPVLRYVKGEILPEGAPENRSRGAYVHPLYSLDGRPLTHDGPKDHYHHRGLSWMWPKVTFDGITKDLWDLRGIRQHYERHEADALADRAVLRLWNRWEEDSTSRRILNEQVTLTVHTVNTDVSGFPSDQTGQASSSPKSRNTNPVNTDVSGFSSDQTGQASSNPKSRNTNTGVTGRIIDIELTLSAIDKPVTLAVSDRGYGGFNLRFAPRKDTTITTSKGVVDKDVDRQRLAWADLSARFGESDAWDGIAIFDSRSNPHFPTGWTLRPYGILNPALASTTTGRTIEPGKPLTLRYRIYVHKGRADPSALHTMFRDFCPMRRAKSQDSRNPEASD